ncbi:MAG: hypothetical protein S4CHLAM81_04780 [Chlamydiales bacterium]|nr:hypothetical protein [Chlamydiales bacterium]MCH9635267.1 hypothetical protein [Chlamydiales bacterium]
MVQVQVQFALLQAINALIAWRNLDFLRQDKEPYERKWVFALIGGAILGTLALFAFQGQFFAQGMEWVRSPRVLLSDVQQHPAPIWYVVGGIGAALFASRIWVQWWIAEFHQKSALGRSYWILSILGSTILLLYSWYTRDVVIAFYNLFSLIPYLRNLMLIRRQKRFSFKEM